MHTETQRELTNTDNWGHYEPNIMVWYAVIWTLLRTRNERIFSNVVAGIEGIVERVKYVSWKWVLAKKKNYLSIIWIEGRSFVLYRKIVIGVDYFSALKLCTIRKPVLQLQLVIVKRRKMIIKYFLLSDNLKWQMLTCAPKAHFKVY
jgi:hypothetical protein